MRFVRSVAPALVVIVALLGASAAPAVAALGRPFCASDQHACCKGPKLTAPCCRDGALSQTDSTPGQARIELHVNLAPVPAILNAAPAASMLHALVSGAASPPTSPPLDRPTLFSSLLI